MKNVINCALGAKKKRLVVLLIAMMSIGQVFGEEGMARIIIYRPFSSSGWKNITATHMLFFDGQLFGAIPSTGYYEVMIEPGKHTIDGYIGNESPDELKRAGSAYTITIDAVKDNTYYASIDEKKKKITLASFDDYNKLLNKTFTPLRWLGKLELKGDIFYDTNGNPVGENANKAKNNQQLAQNQSGTQISNASKEERVLSDVDQNIPTSKKGADDTYVLIIANEEYQFLDNVNFASYDGEIFKEYCVKTLGVPERQIRYCPNASYGILSGGVDWLSYALNNFEGSRAIVYYCGHGIPDEKTNEAYIIPVDGKGTNTATCYSLNKLYKTLADTKASNITYFMDACFTGANKEGSMLVAARGVAREAKKETIEGTAVVFSASSGDETAMTYADKQHGLFTYYLLKKLQETEGDVTYEDLATYISKNVKKDAFLLNEKPQTPVVATSPKAASTWKNMKLK